ncbi:efflux RND transporter permease subunit [Glaciihabitans sp. UYNi722]|uniref:efflux RND transporter permease subunit n=1 Tax=Glaciihabitans sp. UYNi722 TaxID=3156344 RepID=UPI003398470C
MHFLSVFSLRNRALIALVTIVVGVFGGVALSSLKQELIPSLSLPQVYIVTAYPGASPDVVDTDVSGPIEAAIQSVPGLDSSTATSSSNASTVTASFTYGTDIATAEQKVQLAINRISSQLPKDIQPNVLTFNFTDLPVVQVAVTSDLDQAALSAKLDSAAIPDIKKLDGVSDASLLGTTVQRVVITPDQNKLLAAGLSTQAIKNALEANGTLLPSGQITENAKTLTVQAGTRITSTNDLAALPLLGGSAPTKLSDIATVAIQDDPVTGISRVDGAKALTIQVSKAPDGNTVSVSKEVRDLLPDIEKSIGSNTKLKVVFDQAPFIQQSIESLATEGLLGLVFAVIVILVFLLSIRSTLVTAISIPVSVLITFIGMQASGYTLNIITLGALTIAIGRVVDDSIVVIENIKRHLTLGETKLKAIQTAVREVAGAVTASTVTTVAVFLPLALVGDVTGELFRPFALTVSIALAASLFVALTIVPVLAYWFLGNKKTHRHTESAVAERADELDTPTRLQKAYLPVIRWTLKRPLATIIVAMLLLGGTGFLAAGLKTNFIGGSGQNTLTVSQTLDPGTSLEAKDAAAKKVEAKLKDIKGITTTQLSIGSSGSSLSSAFSGGGGATSFSLTTDSNADQEKLQSQVRKVLATVKDAGAISLSTAGGGGFASSSIDVDITATSQKDLNTAADAILARVKKLDVVAEASSNLSASQPYIAIKVDRQKAADAGLSEIAVGGIITQAMNPSATGSVVIDEKTLSIYIDNTKAPTTIAELKAFTIPTATGLKPLSDLATVETVNGPSSITTIKGERSATVSVTPNSNDTGTASTLVRTAVDKVKLPAGASASLGGVTSQQGNAFGQLGLALLVAILIVYVVMVATFKSLRQPLLLLVSVPFAATGAIALQVISGIPLGVPSLIGVLMLIGIVVTNAIVLVDLVNQYRNRGMKVGEAIIHGASRRLRPILMTALATIFALLPLGIGLTGHGGFISQPLAIVVIGGLVSSTLLTLIVLPVLYYLVEGAKERREEYPPLGASVVTRVLAILGGVLLAAGIALGVVGTMNGAEPRSTELLGSALAAVVGLALLIAALVIWLVRSRGNRRHHPIGEVS